MIVLAIVLVIPIIIFVMGIRMVGQEYRGIVERFGKYSRYVEPGFNWIIPFIEGMSRRDIRSHTLDIPPQRHRTTSGI